MLSLPQHLGTFSIILMTWFYGLELRVALRRSRNIWLTTVRKNISHQLCWRENIHRGGQEVNPQTEFLSCRHPSPQASPSSLAANAVGESTNLQTCSEMDFMQRWDSILVFVFYKKGQNFVNFQAKIVSFMHNAQISQVLTRSACLHVCKLASKFYFRHKFWLYYQLPLWLPSGLALPHREKGGRTNIYWRPTL